MRYTFQRSKIWEAGNPVDSSLPAVTVKVPAGSPERRARRKLPLPGVGRIWILTATEDK